MNAYEHTHIDTWARNIYVCVVVVYEYECARHDVKNMLESRFLHIEMNQMKMKQKISLMTCDCFHRTCVTAMQVHNRIGDIPIVKCSCYYFEPFRYLQYNKNDHPLEYHNAKSFSFELMRHLFHTFAFFFFFCNFTKQNERKTKQIKKNYGKYRRYSQTCRLKKSTLYCCPQYIVYIYIQRSR